MVFSATPSMAGCRYHCILPWRFSSQGMSLPLTSHTASCCSARCSSRRRISSSRRSVSGRLIRSREYSPGRRGWFGGVGLVVRGGLLLLQEVADGIVVRSEDEGHPLAALAGSLVE